MTAGELGTQRVHSAGVNINVIELQLSGDELTTVLNFNGSEIAAIYRHRRAQNRLRRSERAVQDYLISLMWRLLVSMEKWRY